MSQPQHTPRPWTWVDRPAGEYEGALGKVIGGDGSEVMNFGNDTQYYPTEGMEPSVADQRLIVAAPDLLDEVKLFAEVARIESPTTQLGGWDWKGMHERLTALIAKVEGRQ